MDISSAAVSTPSLKLHIVLTRHLCLGEDDSPRASSNAFSSSTISPKSVSCSSLRGLFFARYVSSHLPIHQLTNFLDSHTRNIGDFLRRIFAAANHVRRDDFHASFIAAGLAARFSAFFDPFAQIAHFSDPSAGFPLPLDRSLISGWFPIHQLTNFLDSHTRNIGNFLRRIFAAANHVRRDDFHALRLHISATPFSRCGVTCT